MFPHDCDESRHCAALLARLERPVVVVAERSPGTAKTGVSEDELRSFVKAKVRADEITAFWADSIARSSAPDVLQGVRENEIGIAVGLEGLSLARFREIEAQMEDDADLRQAVDVLAKK